MKNVWKFLKENSGFPSLRNLMDIMEKVSWEFSCSFDGERATIGNFTFRLSEDILAQTIGLPQQGERFFKTK